MKGQIAFEALEHVNARYILEAAPDVPSGGRGRGRALRAAAIAAAVLIAAVAAVGMGIWMRRDDPTPPAPPVTESTEMITDTQTGSPTEADTKIEAPVFDGTFTTDKYKVFEESGSYYISFFDEYVATEDQLSASQLGEIYFDSLAEMQEAFLYDRLTEDQMITIQAAFPGDANGTLLCNMSALFDLKRPAGTTVDLVSLIGEYYSFHVQEEGVFTGGWFSYTSEEAMNVTKDSLYIMYDKASRTITRQEQTTFDGVPCEIVESYNSTESYRDIYFEIEEDGRTVSMVVRYLLTYSGSVPSMVASETAPYRVYMYGQESGVFFDASLYGFSQTPTYDWLTSFGLTPYIPTGTGNLATE